MNKKKCPHCDYNCPGELYKKHLKICMDNPEGKSYRPKLKFFDKFVLSPIATLIFIGSIFLHYILGGGIWSLLTGTSLIWIFFKKAGYEAGEKV